MATTKFSQEPDIRGFVHSLYECYYCEMYRYLFSQLHTVDEANLVLSDAFVRVMQNAEKLANCEAETVRRYLFGYAYAALCNHLRYQRRHKIPTVSVNNREDDDSGDLVVPEQFCETDLTTQLLRKEVAEKIKAAISNLSPRARAIIVLKFYGEFKNTEIAEQLGISPSLVGTILQRSLKKMRKELEGYYCGKDIG